MKNIKNKELNIFENIFNTFINKEDMLDQIYKEFPWVKQNELEVALTR